MRQGHFRCWHQADTAACPLKFANGYKADVKYSGRAFPLLTQLGHRTDARDAPHNSRLTMC